MTHPERKLELGILDVEHPAFTVEFAARAERLGYSRYWLAEHHGAYLRGASPDIMTAIVAGLTSHIRVGPAGILLHFRSPLKVAEDFRLLALLFSGRIDLGLARGLPGGPAVEAALLDGRPRVRTPQEHGERIGEISRLLEGTLPEDHPLRDTVVSPVGGIEPPQLWVLGATSGSARVAAELGAAFCVTEHLGPSPEDGAEVARRYRDAFVPSVRHKTPLWSVCAGGTCAETEEEARAALGDLPDTARTTWVGPPDRCREQIEHLADRYGTSEVIVCDVGRSPLAAKRKSYELLAQAFQLGGSPGRRKRAARNR
jgi:luciferase family oxidoreductase group 1